MRWRQQLADFTVGGVVVMALVMGATALTPSSAFSGDRGWPSPMATCGTVGNCPADADTGVCQDARRCEGAGSDVTCTCQTQSNKCMCRP